MGTHISRVKSVDLDAWTDEQAQSMMHWGNSKANKYWEAALDANHIPSDGKMDNFIKTKYISKRWAAQSDRPDPDDIEADDPPVAEKAIERKRVQSVTPATNSRQADPIIHTQQSGPKMGDSLLGLDFGTSQPNSTGPSVSTAANTTSKQEPGSQSNLSLLSSRGDVQHAVQKSPQDARGDLKMSIMSLYASAPQSQQYSKQHSHAIPSQSMATNQAQSNAQMNKFGNIHSLFEGMNVSAAQPSNQFKSSTAGTNFSELTSSTFHSTSANLASNSEKNAWGEDDDFGAMQNASHSQRQAGKTSQSPFDDLYRTSDVWKS